MLREMFFYDLKVPVHAVPAFCLSLGLFSLAIFLKQPNLLLVSLLGIGSRLRSLSLPCLEIHVVLFYRLLQMVWLSRSLMTKDQPVCATKS